MLSDLKKLTATIFYIWPMFLRVILLSPFALIYKVVLHLRHGMFNMGVLKSKDMGHKLLKVGNLALGGSGKTPFVEYLIRVFGDEFEMGVVSRGYGRENDNLKNVTVDDTAEEVGDEPLQIKRKFPIIPVFLKGDRCAAISALRHSHGSNEVIVLDDALQHRKLMNGLNILLSSYERPFYKDFLFPSGKLRDLRSRAYSSDLIIITKSPTILDLQEETRMRKSLAKYNKPVFFTSIKYTRPQHIFSQKILENKVNEHAILVTGIASSQGMKKDILHNAKDWTYFDFGDHHSYSEKDIQKIIEKYGSINVDTVIFTTEKDAQRLTRGRHVHLLKELPIYAIGIEVQFLKEEEKFKNAIRNYVRTNSSFS
ncbi:MAG: tetraacyldisaccharide 4'-kinase [Flavobacteriales bacterium]|nr:tetraacyldisaccharide 4'-kinase [Flavobacteriales bacterium]